MTYKTHLSTGILFSSIVFLLIYKINLTPALILVLVSATFLGSTAPDLDTPTGGLWKKVPAGSVISRLAHPIFIGGHRHLSHSLIGMALLTFLFWLLMNIPILHNYSFILNNFHLIILAFIIGYSSHLLADSFTEAGVPLLFPLDYHFGIPPDPFGKIRIKTGRWFENLVVYPTVNLALVFVIFIYCHQIIKIF